MAAFSHVLILLGAGGFLCGVFMFSLGLSSLQVLCVPPTKMIFYLSMQ